MSAIAGTNVIVAVGSIDGMAGAAACIRHLGNLDIQLVFTQAFQVSTIDVTKWPPNSEVGLIGLAVNNEGLNPNEQLTIDFVNRVYSAGHRIKFIADEHGKKAWTGVLEKCGHSKDELSIKPKDKEKYESSCAILKKALGESADSHTVELLDAGHAADQMNYDTRFGKVFNECTKSNMGDLNRRPYVVTHMANHESPDDKIQGWMNEYAEIKANQPKILATLKDLGDGIALYDCTIGRHDATALFKEAYKTNRIVVLEGTNAFFEDKVQSCVSIATDRDDLNVLDIIKKAGISASGMAKKANIAVKDQDAAIEAVRKAITNA